MGCRALVGLVLAGGVALVGCDGRAEPAATPPVGAAAAPASDPGASGRATRLSAEGADACALVTVDDVKRITGYVAAAQRHDGGACTYATPDSRLAVTVSTGRYVDLRSSLGGTHVPLARGLTGLLASTGWLTTVIYPDGTSVSLVISGRAMRQPSSRADIIVSLADGRDVEMATLYRALADAVVNNSR